MEVRRRIARKGRNRNCQTPGCSRSAVFDVVLLGTEHMHVCTKCKDAQVAAYEHALFGWKDELRDRELVAV